MTPEEFYDKEHGTRTALAPKGMSDSDRNIMASMAHEGCEAHCDDCGVCIHDQPEKLHGEYVCTQCYEDAKETTNESTRDC